MKEEYEDDINNKINNSLEQYRLKEYISIDDIDYTTKKVRITSPHSIKAMNNLGIINEDLEYLTFEEYLSKNPELVGEEKKIQKFRYNHVDKIRKDLIEKVREQRMKIIEEEEQKKRKRSSSSKYRTNIVLDNINSKKFSEKDIKSFKRMRNINKTNLYNRLEMELKKELKSLINNEQTRRDNEKKMKYYDLLEKRLKYENKKRITDEEEKIQLEKEKDKRERKEEEERIQGLQDEEKYEQEQKIKNQKKQLKYFKKKKKEKEAFKNKLIELRNLEHEAIKEKNEQKQIRILKNLNKLTKERKRKRLNSEKNYRNKVKIVEENKKRIEEDIELKNQILIFKHRSQQLKLNKEEERRNREKKLYDDKIIKQLSQNNNNDWQMKLTQGTMDEMQIMELLNNTTFLNEREKKLKEILIKNEILKNKRKENIMNQIHEKERNIDITQSKKDYQNLIDKERRIIKKIDQDSRIKLITQYLLNKREDLREKLEKRNKKVEKFMGNKTNLIHRKREMFDKIMKESDLDNEQYEKILSKKSFDRKSFKSLGKIFPENENKWGISFLFYKNKFGTDNILFEPYEIYIKNNNNNAEKKEYGIKKCDFSFPTFKTIDYDYELTKVKQYFGKTSYMTKRINIYPKMIEKINMNKIYGFLEYKTIFIDYPFKAFGKIVGFIYSRVYYYMFKNYLYADNRYVLTDELIETIRYNYEKKGIILEHPEILCDVRKLQKIENSNGKIKTTFEENYIHFIPFEITSLNTTSKDFKRYIKIINTNIGGNYQIYNNEYSYYK